MKHEPFVIERTYNAPVEKVWKAITDINEMRQWYMSEIEDFKPVVGFTTVVPVKNKVSTGKDFIHHWKITEVVPGKKISYEWRYEGNTGNSLVTFELKPEGNKTTLTLTHIGLETFDPATNPQFARENFEKGWTGFIDGKLKKFVEQ
jgi:uncharacterized protein YndB with AHSA1/START domain